MAEQSGNLMARNAQQSLELLKLEVAREIGWNSASVEELEQQIDRSKFEVARQIDVPLTPGNNGELTSRQAGAVGGRLGGRLGGQMVRRMIASAEQALASGRQD